MIILHANSHSVIDKQQHSTISASAEGGFFDFLAQQAMVLAVAVLLLYAPTVKFELTQYDDSFFLESSKQWHRQSGNLLDAFTKTVFDEPGSPSDRYYRPLLILSFYLGEWLWDSSLVSMHSMNILLHFIGTLLLLLLLRKLIPGKALAFWLTLFFAIHPSLTQAVAWIPGRNDSMFSVFAAGSLLFLINYRRDPRMKSLLLHLLLFALAVFTKETAVLLPLLFIMAWRSITANQQPRNSMTYLMPVAWAVILGVFFITRMNVIGDAVGLPLAYTLSNLLSNLPALLLYSGKMLLPFNLSTFPILQDSTLIFGIVALAATAAAVYFTTERNLNLLAFALFWWIIFLLPAIVRTSSHYESVFLEHRLYFPLMGFLLLWAQTDAARKGLGMRGISYVLIPMIAACFGLFAFLHRADYKKEEAYWSSAVQDSPNSSFARRALGNYYVAKGLATDAQLQYAMALQLNPDLPEVRNNLGRLAMNRAEFETAEKYLRQEIERYPRSYTAYYNLGLVKMNQKIFDSAEYFVRKSISLNPSYYDSRNDLSVILAMQGRFEEALLQSISLAEENPDYGAARRNIKIILNIWGDQEKVRYYRELLVRKGISY